MGRVSYIVVLAFVLNNVVAATEKGHDYCPVMAMRNWSKGGALYLVFTVIVIVIIDIVNVYPVALHKLEGKHCWYYYDYDHERKNKIQNRSFSRRLHEICLVLWRYARKKCDAKLIAFLYCMQPYSELYSATGRPHMNLIGAFQGFRIRCFLQTHVLMSLML